MSNNPESVKYLTFHTLVLAASLQKPDFSFTP
jgi:hypothetical protein